MIFSVAYAAQTAVAHHEEPLLQSGEFWVGFTFCLVLVLLAKPAGRAIGALLQKRSDSVKDKVEEAERLAAEAERLLEKYKKQSDNAEKDIRRLAEKTGKLIDRLNEEAQEKFERSLKKQEESSFKRLKGQKDQALAEIRDMAVNISVKTAEEILKASLSPEKQKRLMEQTIDELPALLKKD